ncbi:MAG TPA: hypothetical protein VGM90_04480 [Kofleriaceae bacterium]|jgi:hypothetical protein
MSPAQLMRWSALADKRARSTLSVIAPFVLGGVLAAWVAWRSSISFATGSHAWTTLVVLSFAIAFMRVPFHLYWRPDASLLAQLPIDGKALLAPALSRCVRAAAMQTLAVAIGAAPLFAYDVHLALRHLVLAGALGVTTALFLPAVALFGATVVALSPDRTQTAPMLGALPGFAGTAVIIAVFLVASWLTGGEPAAPPPIVLAILLAGSVLAFIGTLSSTPRYMGQILRDVSALDRQRLATLEIKPPTGIENAIANMLGEGALPYRKDARLMRRRYPMAYALGALAFVVLVIVGISQPEDPLPYLIATLGGGVTYALALRSRVWSSPIELARLSASLPISPQAIGRAKRAWVLGWFAIFIALPAVFTILRIA